MSNHQNPQPTLTPAQIAEDERLAASEEAAYRAEMDADYWSEVSQGRWDDDPSPYSGDYSEM